jgi:hypothetical protein
MATQDKEKDEINVLNEILTQQKAIVNGQRNTNERLTTLEKELKGIKEEKKNSENPTIRDKFKESYQIFFAAIIGALGAVFITSYLIKPSLEYLGIAIVFLLTFSVAFVFLLYFAVYTIPNWAQKRKKEKIAKPTNP